MRKSTTTRTAAWNAIALFAGIVVAVALQNHVFASARIVLPPKPALKVVTSDLPKTPTADVYVLAVTLAPGDATLWHTHPTPTFTYVASGTGTWEYRGGRQIDVRTATQAIMEPANVALRVANRGKTPLSVVIFQATSPGQVRVKPAP